MTCFLGEWEIVCRGCHGKVQRRSSRCKFRGLESLTLDLTVTECREVFEFPKLIGIFEDAHRLRLGNLRIGQNTSSFSGGSSKAQTFRVVRARICITSLIVLDEPSAGLSQVDCPELA